jgi:hypothetical protein
MPKNNFLPFAIVGIGPKTQDRPILLYTNIDKERLTT